MPENVIEIKVLLSSPRDLLEERKIFVDIVDDANHYINKVMNLRLQLIMWEKDTYPSIGKDSQDVINKQLPEYDLYVGIVGMRIGTKTARSASGTIEEYQEIYKKHKKDKGKKVIFYFKKIKKDIDEINTKDINKRNSFRERLKKDGVYYGEYYEIHDFRRLLCFHLYCHAVEFQIINKTKIKEDSLEFIVDCINEGNKYSKLANDCLIILYENLIKGSKDIELISKSVKGARKASNFNLLDYSVKNFINKLNNLNSKINFYVEIFYLLYNSVIDNYTKGILGFEFNYELPSIIEGSKLVKDKLLELNTVIKKIKNEMNEIAAFDVMFNTSIIFETCELYERVYSIFKQCVNLTAEFIKTCEKIQNASFEHNQVE